jgi:hypothetical protein
MARFDFCPQGLSEAGHDDLGHENRCYIMPLLAVWALGGRDADVS